MRNSYFSNKQWQKLGNSVFHNLWKLFHAFPEANTQIQDPTTSIAFHVWSSLYVPKFGISDHHTTGRFAPTSLVVINCPLKKSENLKWSINSLFQRSINYLSSHRFCPSLWTRREGSILAPRKVHEFMYYLIFCGVCVCVCVWFLPLHWPRRPYLLIPSLTPPGFSKFSQDPSQRQLSFPKLLNSVVKVYRFRYRVISIYALFSSQPSKRGLEPVPEKESQSQMQ